MTSTQTRNRPGPFGLATGASSNEQTRSSNKVFGSSFGNGASAWNGDIWSHNAIGSGMKSGVQDTVRAQNEPHGPASSEAVTGSRSLLASSESDGFNARHGSWKSVDDISPSLSRAHTNRSGTSPVRCQNSNQLIPQAFVESNPAASSYFPGSANISSRSSQKNYLDATSGNFVASGSFEQSSVTPSSRHNSDGRNQFVARKRAFEGNETEFSMPTGRPSFNSGVSGYNSSVASRSGSQPPSRSEVEYSCRDRSDVSNIHYSRFNTSTAASNPHRPHLSAEAPPYVIPAGSSNQRFEAQLSSPQLDHLVGDIGKFSIGKENQQSAYAAQRETSYGSATQFLNGYSQDAVPNGSDVWNTEESGYHGRPDQFLSTGSGSESLMSRSNSNRAIAFGNQYSHSPSNSDARNNHGSPYYSAAETPPLFQQRGPSRSGYNTNAPAGQVAMLDRRLRGLQQEQQGYVVTLSNVMQMQFRNQFTHSSPYDFQPQHNLRTSQPQPYYQIRPTPNLLALPHVPRGPASDHDLERSPLLIEFREKYTSPNNRIKELKDIYNHIVEFSGDQHGSRFIQKELETANSDEKDQVFRELMSNSIQLMVDVFGNYVIQKFFQHGNQSQKRSLANQMKNRVLELSCQMYGCRVVQKALEHILTDQQAQLIKELEHNVLKCVKDQNGNHVVQKAIERVPAEHVQFIINAFTGQVHSLATHTYGCRVVQRMLEYCDEPTQKALLQELHACAPSLIVDQFGNYVTQHVIAKGKDEDRDKIIALVTTHLIHFSKHKFASNVVEKTIQYSSRQQRQKIVDTLTVVNEKGQSPLQIVITDQYGNYVIQKLLNVLEGTERDDFVELTKTQIAFLKRFSCGKQVQAIEKIIYDPALPQTVGAHVLPAAIDTSVVPTPPLFTGAAQSPQSSPHPSTNASSVDGLNTSRKSSGSNVIGVLTPTST